MIFVKDLGLVVRDRIKNLFRQAGVILLLFLPFGLAGQPDSPEGDSYFDQAGLRYGDQAYNPNIRTIRLFQPDFPFRDPVIRLGTPEKLRLSFDEIRGEGADLRYRFIHCTWNWQPSNLDPAEFLEGFPDNPLTGRSFSVNTFVPYVHYSLEFPNEDAGFRIPGNYLVVVSRADSPDSLVVTRRFVVAQPSVKIDASVRQATLADLRKSHQEISLRIETNLPLSDPFNEIKVVIRQNGRWDNASAALKPMLVKGKVLEYSSFDDNVFPGGSEFRYFNCKDHRYLSERLASIHYADSLYQVTLIDDEPRGIKRYQFSKDINGHFQPDVQGGSDPDTEADYMLVHFFVPMDEVLKDGNLYVAGEFNNWNLHPENRMRFDERRKGYAASILLKQGYYNYQFLFLNDSSPKGETALIEGDHYETENEYVIMVYYCSYSGRYDIPAGYLILNSRDNAAF